MLDAIQKRFGNDVPSSLVIWLHGLGASGDDFADIVPELHLKDSLQTLFVFPQAPIRSVTLNGGFPMPAWYDILGLTEGAPQDRAGMQQSEASVRAWIEHGVQALNIPYHRIALVGFSQGGVLALYTGLRFERPLAGIVGLSTYLMEPETVYPHTPIWMGHGTQDTVVAYDWGKQAADRLVTLGPSVTFTAYPGLAHSVSMKELREMGQWLSQRLSS